MNIFVRLVVALWLGCVAFPSQADDVTTGVTALRQGDFTGASTLWADMARTGNPAGVNNLAFMYISGNGVPRDIPKGIELLGTVADFGHPMAQYNLALIYANADKFGLAQDGAATRATDLYRAAAYGGHVRAQYLLGVRTFLSVGAASDAAVAYTWLTVARNGADAQLGAQIDALLAAAWPLLTEAQMAEATTVAATTRASIQATAKAYTEGARVGEVLPVVVAAAR